MANKQRKTQRQVAKQLLAALREIMTADCKRVWKTCELCPFSRENTPKKLSHTVLCYIASDMANYLKDYLAKEEETK